MNAVQAAVRAYIEAGFVPVRLKPKSKQPLDPKWPTVRIDAARVEEAFGHGENVGILLGPPSRGLADVDIDVAEGLGLAPAFLPSTQAVFGRTGRLRSHWLYFAPDVASAQFRDPDGTVLVEVRAADRQTLFPPSVHPSGEEVTWEGGGMQAPAEVSARDLTRAVRYHAAATLLVRHYPEKGSRNECALALAGALAHAGWDEDDITDFVLAVAEAAGDEEAHSRLTAARDTARKFDKGGKVTGVPTLGKVIGKGVAQRFVEWIDGPKDESPAPQKGRATQATQLLELFTDAELFHDQQDTAYTTIQVEQHRETHRIGSQAHRDLLARGFYETYGKAVSNQPMQDALGVLRARARYSGAQLPVYLRVGEADGAGYLDLGNERWEAIRFTKDTWDLVAEPPVKFRRPKGVRALPAPARGGHIDLLKPFVNVADDDQFTLLVGYLLAGFRPATQFPVLVLNGEQGSAKSSLARIVKELLDPSASPLQAVPRNVDDLVITANHSWVYAIDNLSWISAEISDAFCRLATGGGVTRRQLYTDDEPITIEVQRLVLLNGIGEIVTRGDLLDRSIMLSLPAIPPERRRDETAFWQEFEAAQPAILGALLTAAVAGLRALPTLKLDSLPRMAAFARWVSACEEGFDWEPGTFMRAYMANRGSAAGAVLESSSLYGPLKSAIKSPFKGTMGDLLEFLRAQFPDGKPRGNFPKTPGNLATAIERIQPQLRDEGWLVERNKSGRTVEVTPPTAHESQTGQFDEPPY